MIKSPVVCITQSFRYLHTVISSTDSLSAELCCASRRHIDLERKSDLFVLKEAKGEFDLSPTSSNGLVLFCGFYFGYPLFYFVGVTLCCAHRSV